MLSAITVPPAARKEARPQAALDPAPAARPGQQPAGFMDHQGFEGKLPKAFDDDVKYLEQMCEIGKSRDKFGMDHIDRIMAEAKRIVDHVLGHLAAELPVPIILEVSARNSERLKSWTDDQLRYNAVETLLQIPSGLEQGQVAALLAAHRANPGSEQGERNRELQIMYEVANRMDKKFIERVIAISGYPATADAEKKEITVDIFKHKRDADNQRALWRLFSIFIHEYLHFLEHPDYRYYREAFGFGSSAEAPLREGVVNVLHEIVLSFAGLHIGEERLRRVIEGDYFTPEPLVSLEDRMLKGRYDKPHAAAMRLAAEEGIENLLAAFFRGDVRKINRDAPPYLGPVDSPPDDLPLPDPWPTPLTKAPWDRQDVPARPGAPLDGPFVGAS
jgi:hypothetical protein